MTLCLTSGAQGEALAIPHPRHFDFDTGLPLESEPAPGYAFAFKTYGGDAEFICQS